MRPQTILLCTLMLLLAATPAWAQAGRAQRGDQPRPGAALSPEALETAWSWQARSIAHDMSLDEETTDDLIVAYIENRKTLGEQMRERGRAARGERAGKRGGKGASGERGQGAGNAPAGERGQGAGRGRSADGERPGAEAAKAMVDESRASLSASIGAFLSTEQTTKAMKTLGSYSRQWDLMVSTIVEMDPPVTEPYAALTATGAFVQKTAALRATGDREKMRDTMSEAPKQLTSDLSKVMTDEQIKAFEKATRMRRRSPAGAEGGRGEGRGQGRGKGRGATESETP